MQFLCNVCSPCPALPANGFKKEARVQDSQGNHKHPKTVIQILEASYITGMFQHNINLQKEKFFSLTRCVLKIHMFDRCVN